MKNNADSHFEIGRGCSLEVIMASLKKGLVNEAIILSRMIKENITEGTVYNIFSKLRDENEGISQSTIRKALKSDFFIRTDNKVGAKNNAICYKIAPYEYIIKILNVYRKASFVDFTLEDLSSAKSLRTAILFNYISTHPGKHSQRKLGAMIGVCAGTIRNYCKALIHKGLKVTQQFVTKIINKMSDDLAIYAPKIPKIGPVFIEVWHPITNAISRAPYCLDAVKRFLINQFDVIWKCQTVNHYEVQRNF